MTYQLTAVSFLDRWAVNVRFFLLFLVLFGILLALQIAWSGSPTTQSMWTWAMGLGAFFCLLTYSARGPNNTGSLEIDPARIVVRHNDEQQEIAICTVTQATLVNVFGNRLLLLEADSEKVDLIYSQYSNAAAADFRSVLGQKLKYGNVFDYLRHCLA